LPVIRAALFDLDDTLIDHQHASRAAMVGVRERFPAFQRLTLAELGDEHQRILDLLHHEVALGQRTVADARIDRYRRLFAFAGDAGDHASAAAELHRRVYQASRCRVAGALELLQALHPRVRIAVVTNNTVAEQKEKLATFGLSSLVDALVTSEEIGAAKPDGRIFAAALQRIECAPGEAVMIGDSWKHDVLGATAAGISPIWFNRNGAAHPDPEVAPQIAALLPTADIAEMIAPWGQTRISRGFAVAKS
jgi:HAD superfamily hydrolase (TIGR01549 family)